MSSVTQLKLVTSIEDSHPPQISPDLFAGLPHTRVRNYQEGELLIQQGESTTYLYRLNTGLVKLLMYKPDGTSRIVRVCTPGDIIGTEALFTSKHHHTVIALSPTNITEFPLSDIHQKKRIDSDFYFHLSEALYSQLELADRWISDFSSGCIKERIAKLLHYLVGIEQRNRFGQSASSNVLELLKVKDIADIVAATPESVSRILAEFKRKAILKKCESTLSDKYTIDLKKLTMATAP